MDNHPPHAPRCTAFDGYRLVTSGTYLHVAFAIRALLGQNANAPVLVFDDDTGAQIDFDLRGTDQDLSARLSGMTQLRLKRKEFCDLYCNQIGFGPGMLEGEQRWRSRRSRCNR